MNKEQKQLRSAYLEVEDCFSCVLDQLAVDIFELQMYEFVLDERFDTVIDPLLVFLRVQENLKKHLMELTQIYGKCQQLHRNMMSVKHFQ